MFAKYYKMHHHHVRINLRNCNMVYELDYLVWFREGKMHAQEGCAQAYFAFLVKNSHTTTNLCIIFTIFSNNVVPSNLHRMLICTY